MKDVVRSFLAIYAISFKGSGAKNGGGVIFSFSTFDLFFHLGCLVLISWQEMGRTCLHDN